ncbi:MAG: hypothetical protein PUF10_02655 [Bacteroidales bacterium]|nr:hypothetical protein [Bacteroidales bacterium]
MSKYVNYYFRAERLQQKVVEYLAIDGNIRRFAKKIGLNNANFNKDTGLNIERWRNPKADTLASFAVFFELPIDYFFVDDEYIEDVLAEKSHKPTMSQEQIIASKQETIDAQRLAIDALRDQVEMLQKRLAESQPNASISETKTA